MPTMCQALGWAGEYATQTHCRGPWPAQIKWLQHYTMKKRHLVVTPVSQDQESPKAFAKLNWTNAKNIVKCI